MLRRSGAALALLLAASPARAAETVPVELQATLFFKILHYDTALAMRQDKLTVVVAANDLSASQVTAIAKGLQRQGVVVKLVAADKLRDIPPETVAIYVAANGPVEAVARLCQERQLLSLTDRVEWVDRGLVSIGLEVTGDNKPQIVVHARRLREEGHSLAAALLSIARVTK